ncbi:MAG: VIT domain-containing protein, partial [Planctomycetota bacterium]
MRLFFIALASILALASSQPQDPVSLKADGRVGRVVDQQGMTTMRPVARQRWTPIARGRILMPGDQVRSNPRGANAAEIELAGGCKVILGPGAVLEIEAGDKLHLIRGDLAIEVKDGAVLTLLGPGDFEQAIATSQVFRADEGTVQLDKNPRWLDGYRNSTTDEWLGSLIAQVDGREVPLSVGYHKVEVDIKDQIARSTIEQSFVNSTKQRLEGVFYFPLPAGASISGFGMWIGGELVEADIVEKQRAREIFEDILRRRKDPGLLEWSGGNLFKARVFPIEPHSEKRVRIRYTQALPLHGSKLTYNYALRSELLRSRPLRDLSVRVNIDSATKIRGLSSPSHELRIRKTDHNAVLEFDAQEYSPQKDFELEIELEEPPAISLLPHRRGADGYFMMLLTPPGESSGLERELIPDGEPLDLVLLADTSASMGAEARATQALLLESLLSLLGSEDRFRLMTVDLAPRSFRAEPASVTEENTTSALRFLEARESMGWTDLDRAYERALSIAEPGAILLYLGDGIGTTGDASPEALAQRIRAMGAGSEVSSHAISTASTYELPVLEAIASIGGGSLREAGNDPQATARRFLSEIARPAIKGLQIEFEGIQVARVYPEILPNLAAGSQQVILGRYQPGTGPEEGRVSVRGELAGEPVHFAADVSLPQNDAGNSFIPRLWARQHVDALLREGSNPLVIADIVSFSEEYGIMTPYTSLLVLESDADRERYGVTRRVKMRDGEQFFAAGRDRANQEILRQQMKLAKTWRLQIWRRFAKELADLGASLYQQQVNYAYGGEFGAGGSRRGLFAGAKDDDFLGLDSREFKSVANAPMDQSAVRYDDLDFDPAEGFDKEVDELVALEEELAVNLRLEAAEPSIMADSLGVQYAAKRVARQSYLAPSSPMAFGQSLAG